MRSTIDVAAIVDADAVVFLIDDHQKMRLFHFLDEGPKRIFFFAATSGRTNKNCRW